MKFSKLTVQTSFDSPLGRILLAAHGEQLAGVWFAGQSHLPEHSAWPEAPDHPVLQQARQQLSDYLEGRRTAFDLPLDLDSGTPFQQAVWHALQHIPRGTTCSYGALAEAIGKPGAVSGRAVGAAVGRNPLSIIVPCHRVLSARGGLTGYAGGLVRKISLLQLEGAAFLRVPASRTQLLLPQGSH